LQEHDPNDQSVTPNLNVTHREGNRIVSGARRRATLNLHI
jgi:hypothetical protein